MIVALMAIAFIASTVVAQPDWYRSMEGMVPQLPPGSEILIVALVGTNFSINAAFYTSYGIKENRRTRADYRDITLVDTIPGIVAPGIMTALVIMVAAAVLGKTGAEGRNHQRPRLRLRAPGRPNRRHALRPRPLRCRLLIHDRQRHRRWHHALRRPRPRCQGRITHRPHLSPASSWPSA